MTNYSICLHLRWLVPLCHCHIKVLVSRAHALPNVQLQGLAEGLAQSRLQGDRRECCQSGGAEGSPPMTAPCPILPLPLQLIKSGGHQPLQGAQPAGLHRSCVRAGAELDSSVNPPALSCLSQAPCCGAAGRLWVPPAVTGAIPGR